MTGLPTLRLGCHTRGAAIVRLVGDLQKYLNNPCIDANLTVDGEFGPQTKSGVQGYQRLRGLNDDGVVGRISWERLTSEGFRARPAEDSEIIQPDGRDDPHWPPRPAGAKSPNGRSLFGGSDFSYSPHPTVSGYIKISSAWTRSYIKSLTIPQLEGVEGAPGDGKVLVHAEIAHQLRALFSVWESQGLSSQVLTWAGSWVPRFVRGSTSRLSNHSFGTAFDINAAWNGFRREPARLGKRGCLRELVPAAWELGFFWGGWYNDGMHFEAYKALSAEEVQAVENRLKEKKS